MIAHVNGRITHKSIDSVIIDVNGVGYEVFIPLSTYYKLPGINETITLNVYTHLREDAIQLYGFLTPGEKEAFQMLLGVSGVGPKLARNILSGIPVNDLISAIASSDKDRLSAIPGIGGKSAERLILELRDKIKKIVKVDSKEAEASEKDALSSDVISALDNLGYKNVLAAEAVKKARARLPAGFGFEELFKEALKFLSMR